jgi:sugar/nucleoside kinase (ribokinase family)
VTRLVSVGNVIVDLVARVPKLPPPGGDVVATDSAIAVGGAFNAMVSATRLGLPTVYAGGHGTGYFGDLVRAALRGEGIVPLLGPDSDRDSGYDVALIDSTGERTFVTVFGAEAWLGSDRLAEVLIESGDVVLVSGYGLLPSTNAAALAPWIDTLPRGATVVFDPGPLVADIVPEAWASVARRADWITCNEREAGIITGLQDAAEAAAALSRNGCDTLVRQGASGCLVCTDGVIRRVPGYPVSAIDTNGAGDTHTGAFIASLVSGLTSAESARRANAAAALAVTRQGPATAPTEHELDAFIAAGG